MRWFTFLITVLHILLFEICPGSSEARTEFPVTSVISDLFIPTSEVADLRVAIFRHRVSENHGFLGHTISNGKKTNKQTNQGGKAEGSILWNALVAVTNSLGRLELPPWTSDRCFYNQKCSQCYHTPSVKDSFSELPRDNRSRLWVNKTLPHPQTTPLTVQTLRSKIPFFKFLEVSLLSKQLQTWPFCLPKSRQLKATLS